MKVILLFLTTFVFLLSQDSLKNLNLQLQWKHQFQFAGFYIAKEKGFYKNAGINLVIEEYSGEDVVENVLDGEYDFGIGRSNLILKLLFQGESNLYFLLNHFQSSPQILLGLQSSGITQIKDLKGKTLMIDLGEVGTASIQAMFDMNDINNGDFTRLSNTYNINDLIEGKVDMMSAYLSNEVYELEKIIYHTLYLILVIMDSIFFQIFYFVLRNFTKKILSW